MYFTEIKKDDRRRLQTNASTLENLDETDKYVNYQNHPRRNRKPTRSITSKETESVIGTSKKVWKLITGSLVTRRLPACRGSTFPPSRGRRFHRPGNSPANERPSQLRHWRHPAQGSGLLLGGFLLGQPSSPPLRCPPVLAVVLALLLVPTCNSLLFSLCW